MYRCERCRWVFVYKKSGCFPLSLPSVLSSVFMVSAHLSSVKSAAEECRATSMSPIAFHSGTRTYCGSGLAECDVQFRSVLF